MSFGRPRSANPFAGDPPVDPSLEKPLSLLRALAGSEFEVLGPLGRDAQGEHAFLAREVSRDRLVVLKRRSAPGQAADVSALQVITKLDSSVPPPAGSCSACQAPFINWEPSCPECGANVAGNLSTAPGTSPEKALAAVRHAAGGYEVFGTMNRAVGGATVYFARERSGGHLVALRLEEEHGPGPGYTVTATRMMRPKLLYGAVGGEASGASGVGPSEMWTPIPSPPIAVRAADRSGGGSSLGRLPAGEKVCPQCGHTYAAELRLCPRDGSALRAMETADALIGRIIADRYHIIDRLGQGGMGTVYLAEHVRMGRRCAVKVMNPTLLNDPDSLDRFTREAKNASLLNHPHVAAIYDFGEAADGIVYLAMEFVEGESLAAVLARTHGLPEQKALELGSQVADALSAAHEMGIVHRDLKPDNIMLCHSKAGKLRVKVVDFGIAKATEGSSQTVTRTGYVVGTPAYMSPEQILGDPLDGRSDLYSLGCILFEMLTGQRAFTGPSGEVSIRRRLTEPPPRPRSLKQALSKSLDPVITKAMARAPEQRFKSAGELRNALLAILNDPAKQAKWHGWRPWARPEASDEIEETSLVIRAGDASRHVPLFSPAPFVAPPPLESPPSRPGGAEWAESAQPITRLRHRSARSEGSHTGWLVGGVAGAALIGLVAVLLTTGGGLAGYWLKVSDFWRSAAGPKQAAVVRTAVSEPLSLPEETIPAAPESPAPRKPTVAPPPATIRFGKPLPAASRITVDSLEVRPTPEGLLTVDPGSHVIRVRAPGYRSARRTVSAAAGDTTNLDLVLLPLPVSDLDARVIDTTMGAIVVKGTLPPGAVVRVDGRVAPPDTRVLTVAPGAHLIAVSVPGYTTHSSSVNVEQGSWSDWLVPELTPLSQLPGDTTESFSQTPPPEPGIPPPSADSMPEAR